MHISDTFQPTLSPYWQRFATGPVDLVINAAGLRLALNRTSAGALADVEIGDYRLVARSRLPWRPPLVCTARLRASHPAGELYGTAGFGFWNAPGDPAAGVGALPNALWFFSASPRSALAWDPRSPPWGWKAGAIASGDLPAPILALGNLVLKVPGLAKLAVRAGSRAIGAREIALPAASLAEWHTYRLEWRRDLAQFWVDDQLLLSTSSPPAGPLGFVAWMDNQVAVLTHDGQLSFATESIPHPQWLDLSSLHIRNI